MHVIEGQNERDAVVLAPAPRLCQAFDLRLDVGVRQHDALRAAGGAAGVEHQCRPVECDSGPARWQNLAGCGQHQSDAPLAGHRCQRVCLLTIDNRQRRMSIIAALRPLVGRLCPGERHQDAACTPDRPLGGDVIDARRSQQEHARPAKVGASTEQE